tara:strand:- start:5568 stop:6413 length:846 start_codon:yes stop_codon:yes gene_type:complete
MQVVQEVKTQPIRYKKKSIEEEDKEIEELEAERNKVEEEEVEAEQEAKAEAELNPEEKTFKKRYGDLRRHVQKIQETHDSEIRSLKEQVEGLTRKQVKLPKTDEELEQWAEKYPDVAKIVETIATKKAIEARKDVEEKLKYVDEMQTKVQIEKAETELSKLHPDFQELRVSEDFHDWVAAQPKWIQSALYENDTDHLAAAKAIDLYKLETNKPDTKSETKEAAKSVKKSSRAEEPKTQDRNVWSESRVKNLSSKDWEKHEDAISESIANGTFVYDISGGAR